MNFYMKRRNALTYKKSLWSDVAHEVEAITHLHGVAVYTTTAGQNNGFVTLVKTKGTVAAVTYMIKVTTLARFSSVALTCLIARLKSVCDDNNGLRRHGAC